MPERSVIRADGTVRIHRALVSPERFLIGPSIDRKRLIYTLGGISLVTFLSLYLVALGPPTIAGISTPYVAGTMWFLNFLLTLRYVQFLQRMGSRGGYYTTIHARTIREQPSYRRSSHPSTISRPVPDQQRF